MTVVDKPSSSGASSSDDLDVLRAESPAAASPTAPADGPGDPAPQYVWAPAEPAPRRRRLWLWIGIPVAAVALGAGAASLFLIAPGTSIAGVAVGGLPPGVAADAVQGRLDATTITFSAPDGQVVLTGADLGATVDAAALADTVFSARPAWNVATWFGPEVPATVTLDAAKANAALEARLPDFFSTPTDATLAFDGGSNAYTVTAGTSGAGIDLAAVATTLTTGLAQGDTDLAVTATSVEVPAATTTTVAQSTADSLNGLLATIGFYVGDDRAVPVDPATAASWLTVAPKADGGFVVTADQAAIQRAVDVLPGEVNRTARDATVITDTSGAVLETEVEGLTGRQLGDTAGIAAAFAGQLAAGDAKYPLPVTETPFQTTSVSRNIVVDLGAQMTYLYENGAVIRSWSISSGKAGTPTHTGSFRVYAHVRQQNMGCVASVDYCTPNVPYVSYFNGDEAFHGTYWHNNFGTPMSHGCINMRIDEAQFVYNWAPVGTEVSVRA